MQIEKIDINTIIPYANNAKLHPKEQIEQIKQSIVEFGNNDPIAIDENGVVIEGHGRLIALKELGYKEAEIIRLSHLTEEQKKAYILVHNKLTMNTNFDFELLESELADIEDIDMSEFGFEDFGAYDNFLEKFKPKHTTDDCYTPQNLYDAVKDYVIKKYSLENRKVVRPFYPGGDYQNYSYSNDCVVIDNPPFSIISSICDWYNDNNIDYFLFAPYLTNFSCRANHVITTAAIEYENKAVVNTSFLTNMGEYLIETEPMLQKIIETENERNTKKNKNELPKYEYPDEVITATQCGYLAENGVVFKLKAEECYFIRALKSQKENGKCVFGAGFLISRAKAEAKAKAKAKAKAEAGNIVKWKLSEEEKDIIDKL